MATGTPSEHGTPPRGPRTPCCAPRWVRRRTTNARPILRLRCGSCIEARRIGLWNPADLHLEDGTIVENVEALPPDLPLGYHQLVPRDGWPASPLVVAPLRTHAVDGRMWGWALQLYAARSGGQLGHRRSRRPRATSRSGRAPWGLARSSSTRCTRWPPCIRSRRVRTTRPAGVWRNPLYLAVEQLPGADALGDELTLLANAGRALNRSRIIDRDAVFRLKRVAFDRLFDAWSAEASNDERSGFSSFCTSHGDDLRRFTTYCALAERHGGGWPAWPPSYRSPDGGRVARFAREHQPPPAAPRVAAMAARRAARARRRARRRSHHRSRGRLRPRWRGRMELAGPARARRPRRRTARRLQSTRTGLGTSPLRALEAPAGALRALDLDGPRRDALGGRVAGRPRDGPVPVVLDPR